MAWQACGRPFNAGWLQNKPDATKDEVWQAMYDRRDYPTGNAAGQNKEGNVYGDYVFGHMMKLGLGWDENGIEFTDSAPRSDCQAWCRKYPSYTELLEAATKNVESSV